MDVSELIVMTGCIVAVLLSARLAYVALVARDAEAKMLIERRAKELKHDAGRKVQVWANDVRVVVNYLYLDEFENFVSTDDDERDTHIFHNIRRLKECLD